MPLSFKAAGSEQDGKNTVVVAEKLREFSESRHTEAQNQYKRIVAMGCTVTMVACIIYTGSMYAHSIGQTQLARVISTIGVLLFSSGSLTMSCAVGEIDEGSLVQARPDLVMGCSLVVVLMELSSAAVVQPHAHLLSAAVAGVSGLGLAVCKHSFCLTAPEAFVAYFFTNLLACLATQVWAAMQTGCDPNSQKGRHACLHGHALHPKVRWTSSMVVAFGIVFMLGRYLYQRRRWAHASGEEGVRSPVLAACSAGDAALLTWGFMDIIPGIAVLTIGGNTVSGIAMLVSGLGYAVPAFLKLWIGSTRVYQMASRRFNKDATRALKDGAFIAGLLDSSSVTHGQVWWVHRAPGEEDAAYPSTEKRRNWQQGRVVEVSANSFSVAIRPGRKFSGVSRTLGNLDMSMSMGAVNWQAVRNLVTPGGSPVARQRSTGKETLHTFSMQSRNVPWEALMKQAQAALRCIEWKHVTRDLMQSSTPCANWEEVTQLVGDGNRVDFFMSHSWHDNAESKCDHLLVVADEFYQKNDRHPTFWLDKVCIDQNNISDCLRVLPVNVMAARKMLVLYGDTYASRLWCIWELFTLVSFEKLENVFDRLQIVPLAGDADSIRVLGFDLDGAGGIASELMRFDVDDAKCYDPNEEEKLLDIIKALGEDRFNTRVRALGKGFLTESKTLSEQRCRERSTVISRLGSQARRSLASIPAFTFSRSSARSVASTRAASSIEMGSVASMIDEGHGEDSSSEGSSANEIDSSSDMMVLDSSGTMQVNSPMACPLIVIHQASCKS